MKIRRKDVKKAMEIICERMIEDCRCHDYDRCLDCPANFEYKNVHFVMEAMQELRTDKE